MERDCIHHGRTTFRFHGGQQQRYRCVKCCSKAVDKQRWKKKKSIVAEKGGSCIRCGYSRNLAALEFHHRNPEEKEFALSGRNWGMALPRLRKEADKCDLVCANCHREIEYPSR